MDFFSARPDCADELFEIVKNHYPTQTLISADEPITQNPNLVPISGSSSGSDSPDQPDYYDACLAYIHDILMEEEDSGDSISTLSEFGALVATEKQFYNALLNESNYPSPSSSDPYQSFFRPATQNPNSEIQSETDPLMAGPRAATRVHQREENLQDPQDSRCGKQLASCDDEEEEYEVIHQYDDILLPKNDHVSTTRKPDTKTRKARNRKRGKAKKVVVDLRTLLTLCAEAVSGFDLRTANDLLKEIRIHSSPFGDCIQRVAHYFANGLEARMAGTGSQLYYHFVNEQLSPSGVLKAYQCYATAVPIFRTSFYASNMMILRLAQSATRIHVVDFGIYHGYQWPSLIQHLSERPDGPPRVKITGIDFPLTGFRPAEKVEQTGRRLKAYCERFNVPFEFQGIAKPWEAIREEDIGISEGELVIVNCQYRATPVLDETVELDSPRDAFLKLIRRLNPDIFIHGSLNGTYGVPFFMSRFREALFNFISMFDIYESTMGREDNERAQLEKMLHGTEIMNVVASEGNERVARPETYKQWQVRTVRAGFRQVAIDKDLVRRSKEITKGHYHKDFVVDEDGNWMLQGWKGRILFALSCWKPIER